MNRQVRDRGRSEAAWVYRGVSALIVLFSAVGLLSITVGNYDDGLLIVGSRLVNSGKLPYVDFYTHYGPFGYTIVGLLLRAIDRPAVALRVGQALLLLLLAVLAHAAMRRTDANPARSEALVPIVVLFLSGSATFSSFLSYAPLVASLLLYARATAPGSTPARITLAAGGALFAAGALTRPAFAVYAAAGVLLTELPLLRLRWEGDRHRVIRLGLFFGAALASAGLLFLFLYRTIPLPAIWNGAFSIPARLVAGGARYLEPDFLRRPLPAAIAAGIALAAASLLWVFSLGSQRWRAIAVGVIIGAGLLPALMRSSFHEQPFSLIGFAWLPLSFLMMVLERRALLEDSPVLAAAILGTTAAAFYHYFWSRADAPHLLPALGVAACGAAFVWGRFGWFGRVAVGGLLLVLYHVAARSWHEPIFPIARLSTAVRTSGTGSGERFACEELPPGAVEAVALADRIADPASRFVALASSHAATQASPTYLFATSSRPPYTRWFQYDPGLQSSAAVQREMERELLASGSDTAVVWRAERFLFDQRRPSLNRRSELDFFFDRLYPQVIGTFGEFEVRARKSAAPSPLP